MKRFTFKVPNNQVVEITVLAEDEAEARVKLENFDVEEEGVPEDDYAFDDASLEDEEDIEDEEDSEGGDF